MLLSSGSGGMSAMAAGRCKSDRNRHAQLCQLHKSHARRERGGDQACLFAVSSSAADGRQRRACGP